MVKISIYGALIKPSQEKCPRVILLIIDNNHEENYMGATHHPHPHCHRQKSRR